MGLSREIVKIATSVFRKMIPSVRTHLTTVITAYDGATNKCKAQPVTRLVRAEDPNNKTTVDLPELEDVPVFQFGSGKLLLSCAPQVGSYGVAHVSDRETETWRSNGGINDPVKLRTHNISDSFMQTGAYPFKADGDNGMIEEPIRTDRIELRTRSGITNVSVIDDETISITNENCTIIIDVDSNISVVSEGNLSVDVEGDATIDAAGDVNVISAGDITADNGSGSIVITSSGTITADNGSGTIEIASSGTVDVNGNLTVLV